jgi:pectinesterase
VFYAEYKNTGEGAGINNRVSWSNQLSDKEAKEYSVQNIFATVNAAASQETGWFQHLRTKPFEWPVGQK